MHHRNLGRRRRPQRHALRLENLEDRRLLSITPGELTDAELINELTQTAFHGSDYVGKDGPLAEIGDQLTRLYSEYQVHQQRHAGETFVPSNDDWTVRGTQVLVDAVTYGSLATLKQQLASIGGQVTAEAERLATVLLPLDALDNLAAISSLQFARPVYKPVRRTGDVDSQGDPAMQSDVGRTQFGVDGSGISVGVISDSYNRDSSTGITATTDIASGDLPNNIQIVKEGEIGDSDEGRAMLQIVHDVAPGATLLFASADGGEAAFADSIRDLAQAGADVIVDDIFYLTEPFFQDGLISQAADEVYADGIPYFSAAGNDSDDSYQADFVDSGDDLIATANGQQVNLGRMHDFDPGPGEATAQLITIEPGGTFDAVLQWDQPFGSLGGAGSQNDLDMYLVVAQSGTLVASSFNDNFGDDPFENLYFENFSLTTEFALVIVKFGAGPIPGTIKYINFGFDSEISSFATFSGTSFGHPMAAGAAGVGASSFFMTPDFGLNPPQLNEFSSAGGIPILFDTAGNRLTAPELRDQPRFTGPDNANTTFFGSDIDSSQGNDTDTFPNFAGTSAAAPHVAAVAALMLDLAGGPGSLTPDQVYGIMESTAIDILLRRDDTLFPGGTPILIPDSVGYDLYSGYGLVDAQAALDATPSPVRAVADTAITLVNTPVDINVLGNDLPPSNGGTLIPTSVTIVTQPASGTVAVNPLTGIVTYTPNTGFAGTDTFKYTVTDSNGLVSSPGLVTVRVNQAPVAVNDSAKTITDQAVVISVLVNDSDATPGGSLDPATVTIVTPPTNGSVSINTTTGAVTYTPNAGFSGNDSFTYTVDDNDGATSNVALVSIFVNAPPVAVDDNVSTLANTAIGIDVLTNDFDPTPGGSLVKSSVVIVALPTSGTVSTNLVTGVVTYTPNVNFSGTDTFTYTVNDIDGATSNVATVSVLVNAAPIALDDVATTALNTPVVVNVTTNDFDTDGTIDASSVQVLSLPDNGNVTKDASGNITYTPNTGFQGGDTITYRVQDDRGTWSNVATVTFKVGALHTLSGMVFVDLNSNGVKDGNDWSIPGVTVFLEKTDGTYTYKDLYVTEDDGTYSFTELVTGTYTLREQHPGYFVDGIDTAGTPAPTGLPSDPIKVDEFVGIALAGGLGGTGFNFAESGLSSLFVASFLNRSAFFASGDGISFDGIDLGKGEAFISFDGGINGQLQASAFTTGGGTVTLTLYNKNMQQVAKSSVGTSALTYKTSSTDTYFLKLNGTGKGVSVSTFVIPPISPPAPPVPHQWQNLLNPTDVDDDGNVQLTDVLTMLDAVKRYGVGSLTSRSINASVYLDVDGDGVLTPGDILPVIDRVNRNALKSTQVTNSAISSSGTSATGLLSDTMSSDIAFALAVDSVMGEVEEETLLAKRRRS